jgi:hypothetical protein
LLWIVGIAEIPAPTPKRARRVDAVKDQDLSQEALSTAWDALYDSLPARWHIRMPSYDGGRAAWSVTASGPGLAGSDASQSVTGTGDSEAAALRDLDSRLRGLPRPQAARIGELRHQLRVAFVDGAEAFSRETLERGLTTNELRRIIQRYEGR